MKDKTIIGPESPGAINHVIEFLNPAVIASGTTDKTPLYVKAYDVVPTGELNIQVSYSGPGVAPNDINVKVTLDDAAIEAVNDEQDLEMIPLPTNMYDISSLDVKIPKG